LEVIQERAGTNHQQIADRRTAEKIRMKKGVKFKRKGAIAKSFRRGATVILSRGCFDQGLESWLERERSDMEGSGCGIWRKGVMRRGEGEGGSD